MIEVEIRAEEKSDQRRSEARVSLDSAAQVRPFGQDWAPARLLNISSAGMMAETEEAIEPGTRIWLKLPSGTRHNAEVRWCANGRIGAVFAQEVDPLDILEESGRLQTL